MFVQAFSILSAKIDLNVLFWGILTFLSMKIAMLHYL